MKECERGCVENGRSEEAVSAWGREGHIALLISSCLAGAQRVQFFREAVLHQVGNMQTDRNAHMECLKIWLQKKKKKVFIVYSNEKH